jgi:hypothetical protein
MVSFSSHACVHYDACAGGTDDCEGPGHICAATGPGTHSCTCPINFYGTARAASTGGTSCSPCQPNSATLTSGSSAIEVTSCICDEGYATDVAAGTASVAGAATSRVIASVADQCAAVQCPVNSLGYTSLWSGVSGACTCLPGFSGPPVWDTTLNAFSAGCTACTPVANSIAVTCAELDNSRAVCDTGFHLTVNTLSGVSDTCTACETQLNCVSHGVACSSVSGHTTQISCSSAAPGNYLAVDVVTPCTAVANSASIRCAAVANSRAVCQTGFYNVDNTARARSDDCLGASFHPKSGYLFSARSAMFFSQHVRQ